MLLKWRNGYLYIGQSYLRWAYGFELCWNRRDLILGEPLTEGDCIFLDCIQWYPFRKA